MEDDALTQITNIMSKELNRQNIMNMALYMLIESLPDKSLTIRPDDIGGLEQRNAGGVAMLIEDNCIKLTAHTQVEFNAYAQKAAQNPTSN